MLWKDLQRPYAHQSLVMCRPIGSRSRCHAVGIPELASQRCAFDKPQRSFAVLWFSVRAAFFVGLPGVNGDLTPAFMALCCWCNCVNSLSWRSWCSEDLLPPRKCWNSGFWWSGELAWAVVAFFTLSIRGNAHLNRFHHYGMHVLHYSPFCHFVLVQ